MEAHDFPRWPVWQECGYHVRRSLGCAFSVGLRHHEEPVRVWRLELPGRQVQRLPIPGECRGGIGYKFIDSATTKLAAQVGVGYRTLRPEELIKDDTGAVTERIPEQTQSEVVGTAGVDFEQQFNPAPS